MITSFIHSAVLIFMYMSFLFAIATYKKNNSIADIGWGIGFILVTLYTLLTFSTFIQRQLLVSMLIIVWGTRLAMHIYLRNKGSTEDARYKQWQAKWTKNFLVHSYVQVFLMQGVAMLCIALPIILINSVNLQNRELTFFDLLGFSVWFTGLLFEAVADYQLYIFLQDPINRGQIMMHGLWRYSRHPNYFGELLIWWGIFIIACNVPYGWTTIISPLTISYILLFVSGIPLAEKQLEGLKAFAEYEKNTSIFIPWFTNNTK
jgi:steroid 5-alpha reductase family enzyme